MGDEVRYMHERPIAAAAAGEIQSLLDTIDTILSTEQQRMQDQADAAGEQIAVFPGLPEDLRWRVMVLGCSVEDLNLWIRRDDQDGGRWYTLTEIETGTSIGGVEPREACECFFAQDDVLNNRGTW
jgi:hypothetical protein